MNYKNKNDLPDYFFLYEAKRMGKCNVTNLSDPNYPGEKVVKKFLLDIIKRIFKEK
jgi:hypothetical protein